MEFWSFGGRASQAPLRPLQSTGYPRVEAPSPRGRLSQRVAARTGQIRGPWTSLAVLAHGPRILEHRRRGKRVRACLSLRRVTAAHGEAAGRG